MKRRRAHNDGEDPATATTTTSTNSGTTTPLSVLRTTTVATASTTMTRRRAQKSLLTTAVAAALVTMHGLGKCAAQSSGSSTSTDPPSTPGITSWQGDDCGGLVCLHNSTCLAGNTTFGVETDVGFHTVTNQNGFYCACPDGYAGLDCGRSYQVCHHDDHDGGTTPKCYHGGVCLPAREAQDAQGVAYCDCTHAAYQGERYAGKYCEIVVAMTEYCFLDEAQPDADYNNLLDQPKDEALFCLNGGSCPPRDAADATTQAACTCPDGYFGEHCEYVVPAQLQCSLSCKNGGTCRVGRRDAVWGNRDSFYCDCPPGYGGVQCEHLSDTCADGTTVCLHGATCVEAPGSGGAAYECACPDPYLGGSSCRERQAMELCMPTLGPEYAPSMAVPAFCLNGGRCRDVWHDYVVDFACDCPPLFEGPHCEFLKTADAIGDIDDLLNPSSRSSSEASPAALTGYVALATLGLLAGVFVMRQVRRIRKSRRREEDIVLNLQVTREENNFGAISANGSMLFPGVSPPPSTFSDGHGSNFASGELLHEIDIS